MGDFYSTHNYVYWGISICTLIYMGLQGLLDVGFRYNKEKSCIPNAKTYNRPTAPTSRYKTYDDAAYYPQTYSSYEDVSKETASLCNLNQQKIEILSIERPKTKIFKIKKKKISDESTLPSSPIKIDNDNIKDDTNEQEIIFWKNNKILSKLECDIYRKIIHVLKNQKYSPSKEQAMLKRIQYIDVINASSLIIYEKIHKSESHLQLPKEDIILGLQELFHNDQLNVEFKEIYTISLFDYNQLIES